MYIILNVELWSSIFVPSRECRICFHPRPLTSKFKSTPHGCCRPHPLGYMRCLYVLCSLHPGGHPVRGGGEAQHQHSAPPAGHSPRGGGRPRHLPAGQRASAQPHPAAISMVRGTKTDTHKSITTDRHFALNILSVCILYRYWLYWNGMTAISNWFSPTTFQVGSVSSPCRWASYHLNSDGFSPT